MPAIKRKPLVTPRGLNVQFGRAFEKAPNAPDICCSSTETALARPLFKIARVLGSDQSSPGVINR